jgi:hypothetical protein
MPYFFLIPAFAVWLMLSAAAVLACRFWGPARKLLPYVWRLCAGASVGVLIAHALLWAGIMAAARLAGSAPGQPHQALALLMAGALFIGPFAVTVLGWFAGALTGFVLALRARRKVAGMNRPTP